MFSVSLWFIFVIGCAHVAPAPKFIDGPQGKLRVDDAGSGRAIPVLFVHGNGGNRNQWRHQLAHVRASRRAVTFDLRGMGESEPARNGDYSIKAMVGDVQAVADAAHLDRFVIVGHSYGGAVAAAYAAAHPERVAAVVYADSAGNVKISDEVAAKFLAALRADPKKVLRNWWAPILAPSPQAVKDEVFASAESTPPEVLASALGGLRDVDTVANVNAYRGPKMAIVAAPIAGPASLHRQVQDLRTIEMQGVGHWLQLDNPDEFNAHLDVFLTTLPKSAE